MVPPSLPSAFAQAQLESGKTGANLEQACTYLDEGVPLCFRVEHEGKRRWFSRQEADEWGIGGASLASLVSLTDAQNPFVAQSVEGGGTWWQVEAVPGHESLVFLRPDWLDRVGAEAVLAAPAVGVVLAWNAGDEENDRIMAVGVKRIFDSHDAPITPRIFKWQNEGWRVWGEAVSTDLPGAPSESTR